MRRLPVQKTAAMKHKPGRKGHSGGRVAESIQARLLPLIRLVEQGKYFEVVPAARDLLRLLPNHSYVLKALSFGLIGQHDYAAALPVLEQATRQTTNDPELYNNLGICLAAVSRLNEAVDCFDRALALDGNDPEVWKNKGEAFFHMNRWGEAVPFLLKAIELYPGDFDAAIITLAKALVNSRMYEEAFLCYSSLFEDEPDNPCYLGNMIFTGLATCRWNALEENVSRLRTLTGNFERVGIAPFHALGIPGLSAAELRRIAEAYVRTEAPANLTPLAPLHGYTHERLRIGYLSSNLSMHAVAILTAEVFELHDRSRVEIYAFCWSPEDGTPMRHRIRAAMDHLVRIDTMSDEQAAQAIRAAEIDVLIDLQGLTSGCRPVILAHKPAPVQISWLGFPGTSALPGVDYILADQYLIPDGEMQHYGEQPLYLPNCFQANDRQRRIGEIPTRGDCQLPIDQFVFCAFNHNHKFNPEMFGCWMRILMSVPDSVLWLLADNETARVNLRACAQAHGVAIERLIFAPRVPPERYLARFSVADLFLDTLPFNGGTTASDALWAGLPVLTCSGSTFAGRMAGSLLHSIGLPDLVTQTLADYQAQAVRLAGDREVLRALRERLAANRDSAPCFDTPQFVSNLENVFFDVAKRVAMPQESVV